MITQVSAREEIKIGEGASTAALLLLLLLSVTGSIASANWADGLGILPWAAMGGLGVGYALARLDVRNWLAHLVMLTLGAAAVVSLATFLLPNVLTLQEKLVVLQERSWVWLWKVVAGSVGSDNLIFVLQLAFGMWVLAYTAAWFVYRRHQVWGALFPTGAAILLNIFYAAPQSGLYLGLYILSALLLLVRLNLHTLERWWRGALIGYGSDIGFDFLTYGVLFSVSLLVLVWLVPATAPGPSWFAALDPLQGPWQSVEDQFTRVFSSLRAVGRPAPSTFFGTTLTMGGPVSLGNRPVMDIRADAGRYWRAMVYDKYTGIGWINTHLIALNLGANDERLGTVRDLLRVDVTQTFKIFLPNQNILYAAAEPLQFDLPVEIRYGQPAVGEFDVALVRARRPMRDGDTYAVVSAITVADEDSLRADVSRYSDWIAANYLQLPDDLPARVRAVAETITKDYSNRYDQAAAIEQYLRTGIKYNEKVSAPPAGRDGVDYTLFDRREGYCNYYTSAMAVLARAVGIPARVASGYTLGDYQDGAFHVIEANAHSWPEIYFPAYGWIEFEPTANKPEIERPQRAETQPENPELDSAGQARRRRTPGKELEDQEPIFGSGGVALFGEPRNIAFIIGGAAIVVGCGALAVTRWRRTRRLARLAPAARVYEELVERARWLGVREQTYATPLERSREFGAALQSAEREAERIGSLYARERFGGRTLDSVERAALRTAWTAVNAQWRRAMVARVIEGIAAPLRALRLMVRRWITALRRRSGNQFE